MDAAITKVEQGSAGKRDKSIPDRGIRTFVGGAALLLLCFPLGSPGQQQLPDPQPTKPGMRSRPAEPNGPTARMVMRMSAMRNADRQKQIVADTAHLLQLAQKLNADVSRSDKDQLSVSVVKEAEEIEKLAKTVKDKMKNGV